MGLEGHAAEPQHAAPGPRADWPSPWLITVLIVAFELGLAGIALAIGELTGHSVVRRIGIRWSSIAVGLAATVPLLLALLAFVRTAWRPLRDTYRVLQRHVLPIFAGLSPFQVAIVSLSAGIGEELLFRGVFLPIVDGWLGRPAGIIATSIVFGLAHPLTGSYVVAATFIGGYLAGVTVAAGLGAAVLTHALYDFVALTYLCHWSSHRRSPEMQTQAIVE